MLEIRVRTFPQARAIWFADRAVLPSGLERLAPHQLLYRQVHEKPSEEVEKSANVSEFTTLLSDLSSSENDLWRSIQKGTRQDIRYGTTRLNSELQWLTADDDFRIYEFLAGFYAQKQLWMPERALYAKYIANGIISCGLIGGEMKVCHFYLLDREIRRVRLLWSARSVHESESGADVARLNKMLHWEDLIYFRNELKMLTFDWGGISLISDALQGVDAFKRRFGGTLVMEWDVDWRSRMYPRARRPVSQAG
jgi:hypothetical protein